MRGQGYPHNISEHNVNNHLDVSVTPFHPSLGEFMTPPTSGSRVNTCEAAHWHGEIVGAVFDQLGRRAGDRGPSTSLRDA